MRRRRHEEHTNHEAWAIPYADLMTLLLAFFVVMYAVSVVNEGKFRVMSESLIEAFNGSSHAIAPLPPTRIRPHNIAPAIAAPAGQSGSSIVPIAVPIPPHPVPASGGSGREAGRQSKQQENLGRIEDQVRKALQPLIDRKLVVVRHNPDWLEIEIRTDILFPSGVAQLSEPANAVLRDLAAILARFANPLRVEGFTDDVPISNVLYPSNWELSAARAASVARLFSTSGIAPARLGIIGWGEMRPIADNATVDGRNQNRRVLVVVMSDRPAAQRDHATPENVGEITRLAASPAPAVEMMPTVRVTSGGNGTPSQATGSTESPVLSDAGGGNAGGTTRRAGPGK
ncbi:MAG TPA: flagellar motor protein MotD [Rhodanobacter sp.]